MLQDSLESFLDKVASKSPTPGGGSVSALSGALSSALSSMVCNLTVGKKGYEDVQGDVKLALKRGKSLRKELMKLVEEDAKAYEEVIKVFQLPSDTIEGKERRNQAIEGALKRAAQVPLEIMRYSLEALKLSRTVAMKGNKKAISDAGVAALLAFSALKGASLNVRINLASIKDESFLKEKMAKVESMEREGELLEKETMDIVLSRI